MCGCDAHLSLQPLGLQKLLGRGRPREPAVQMHWRGPQLKGWLGCVSAERRSRFTGRPINAATAGHGQAGVDTLLYFGKKDSGTHTKLAGEAGHALAQRVAGGSVLCSLAPLVSSTPRSPISVDIDGPSSAARYAPLMPVHGSGGRHCPLDRTGGHISLRRGRRPSRLGTRGAVGDLHLRNPAYFVRLGTPYSVQAPGADDAASREAAHLSLLLIGGTRGAAN